MKRLSTIIFALGLGACAHTDLHFEVPQGASLWSLEENGKYLDTAYTRFDHSIQAEVMAVPWFDHACNDAKITPNARTRSTGPNRWVEVCPPWYNQTSKAKQRTVYHELLHQAEKRVGVDTHAFGNDSARFFLDITYGDYYSDSDSEHYNFVKNDLWRVLYDFDEHNNLILSDEDNKWGVEEYARIGASIMNTTSDKEAYEALNSVPAYIIRYYEGVIDPDYLALRTKKPEKETNKIEEPKKEPETLPSDPTKHHGIPIQKPREILPSLTPSDCDIPSIACPIPPY